MLLHKVLWAFGFISTAFVSKLNGFRAGDFGVCEHIVSKSQTNYSTSPPLNYKVNVTITECCVGFRTIGLRCVPECQKVCVNAFCIGNNKCQCNSGYYAVDDFRCLPKCEPPCGDNMACFAPNKCFCKGEYKMVNESYCEPICLFKLVGDEDFECINAKCTAPNECECYEGFHQVSDFQCEPTCSSCENGDCLAPEVCECKDGYEKSSDGVCMPVCDPSCINGNCIGPNVCKCNENFEKYLRSHECLEKQLIKDRQSCENSCQNGTCSDDGTCGCDFEFEMYNDKCLKKCDKKCTNGKCLEDQCICPENYKLSENTTECLPICAFEDGHDCISGVCVAPQTCKCFEGYKFLDARNCTCVPMCNPMCINSICLAEDGCQCHDDFYKISDYECIKNCSIGFKWVHDECMEENLGFESSENEDGLMIFDEEKTTTTEAVMASYEETSESSENDVESSTDDNDEEEGSSDDTSERSSDDTNDTTERQTVMVQKSLQQLIPTTLCIILLSIIFILIISILTTFCFLYRRVNPKNIYYVNQQEKSSNCVYFTRQNDSTQKSSDVECSL